MKKEIALLLADALDSGHYIQSFGRNRRIDSGTGRNTFCIGGVLINLFAIAHPKLAAQETEPTRFMGTSSDVPERVRDWAGIMYGTMATRNGAPFKFGSGCSATQKSFYSLQGANDSNRVSGQGMSFPQMAAWLRIEANQKLI